jgi:hypothetical protein
LFAAAKASKKSRKLHHFHSSFQKSLTSNFIIIIVTMPTATISVDGRKKESPAKNLHENII